MNASSPQDMQRLLAALALAADSPQADFDSFIDDLDVDALVVLVATLAGFAAHLMMRGQDNPAARAELTTRLRARLAAEVASNGA